MHFVEGRIPPDKPPMALASWVKDELDAAERAVMWANGLETLAAIHRIDPARLKREITAAGFVFDAESNVLRNSADDLTRSVFDPEVRGQTDRVVLRFRKPR